MIYCCKDCGFLFRRLGKVEACPLCEGERIRPATAEEAQRLRILLNREKENRKGEAR